MLSPAYPYFDIMKRVAPATSEDTSRACPSPEAAAEMTFTEHVQRRQWISSFAGVRTE